MNSQAIVVLITAPSLQAAQKIAAALVEDKLAACVNIIPGIFSIYRWQDQIQQDEEVLLVVKTRQEIFETRLVPAVQGLHPYELPEIIALPVAAGLPAYLAWIDASTSAE